MILFTTIINPRAGPLRPVGGRGWRIPPGTNPKFEMSRKRIFISVQGLLPCTRPRVAKVVCKTLISVILGPRFVRDNPPCSSLFTSSSVGLGFEGVNYSHS